MHAHLVVPGTTATEFSTPRDGNDPPLPPGPGATASPEEVAAAIVASPLDDDHFVIVRDRSATPTPPATKAADPNGFLAEMRDRLGALKR